LNTKEGGNFYFTPLGKSYVCENGDDQGPLPFYNQDDELVGNLTLFNSKFQPFVKRAKGEWGPGITFRKTLHNLCCFMDNLNF